MTAVKEEIDAKEAGEKRAAFKEGFKEKFLSLFARSYEQGNLQEQYSALAFLIKDEISKNLHATEEMYRRQNVKQVYYFSIEFLPGRFLMTNLLNLGLERVARDALAELSIDLDEIKDQEEDPGLGNGGLGRLASAFMDSLASLAMPGYGCGIRYRYGFFEQQIVNGEQTERPDNWLKDGCIWEYRREQDRTQIKLGGYVRVDFVNNKAVFSHEQYETVWAVPYDIPIVGYQNGIVNVMRLWSAEADSIDFEFHTFSSGQFAEAFRHKAYAEAISQVLYPDDSTAEGKRLRLKQQYFFVSAGLQNIVRRLKEANQDIKNLDKKIAVHINDTHPAISIAELMRILLDEEGLSWDEAWKITAATISYTNHTIMPEALEKWPVDMFRQLLPRIYMIIEEINSRFCREITNKYPKNPEKIKEMAIISEGVIRMGNLAIVSSHSVNGVARLHTQILKERVMNNFNAFYPGKFNNKTNGIVPRRWICVANPQLCSLINEAIGPGWIKQTTELERLGQYAGDVSFQEKIVQIKTEKKRELASFIYDKYKILLDPDSIFDIHIKRIHGYKRQLLNALHIMDLYNRLCDNPKLDIVPRTFVFGGKAAPAYYLAKRVINLINYLADVINNDAGINDKLKVVFLENYNVSLAELIIPAADVSEQISTASKEASGTGNMKFIMNGAVTIGTMDGANIEIHEQVGADNFISFGLTADEVINYYQYGGYSAWDYYHRDPRIKKVCDQLIKGLFLKQGEFQALFDHLLYHNDEFFVLADFAAYVDAQNRIDKKYRNKTEWTKMGILNIAHSGVFSSDRTINEYAKDIWEIMPVHNSF